MEMSHKLFVLSVLVVISTIVLSACGPSATTTPITTPIPQPFETEITILYKFDEDIPVKWQWELPRYELVGVSFDYSTEYEYWVWSPIIFRMWEYADVTLFGMEVDPPNDGTYFGECRWDVSSWMSDDDTFYEITYKFRYCTQVAGGTEIPVEVRMAYCKPYEDGLLCQKQGLKVFVGEEYITFSAEGNFLPEYREWILEVLNYYGGSELPVVLQPGWSYTIPFNK